MERDVVLIVDCCKEEGVDVECIGSCEPVMCQFFSTEEGTSFLRDGMCSIYEDTIKTCCSKGIIFNKLNTLRS